MNRRITLVLIMVVALLMIGGVRTSMAVVCPNGDVVTGWADCGDDDGDLVGPPGPQGPAGPAGPAGESGKDGTNGTNGKDGVNGTNGQDGINGTNGTNGTNGKDGINGLDGKDGKDASNVIAKEAGALGMLHPVFDPSDKHLQIGIDGASFMNYTAIGVSVGKQINSDVFFHATGAGVPETGTVAASVGVTFKF